MHKSLLLLLFSAMLVSACQQKPSYQESVDFADMAMEEAEEAMPITRQQEVQAPPLSAAHKPEVVKKKIIKDGNIGLRVADLEKTKARVDALLKQYGAYYASENLNNSDWESSYNLNIRIPSSNFEPFIQTIETGNGEILHKEIEARDVTDQFIDLETRLSNKRAYLKRYKALLGQAKTIADILEIEEKVRRLEEEIESTTGRLKYLGDLVNYSTLRLNMYQKKDFKYNPAKRDRFSERIKQSLSKGWFGFMDFLLLLIKMWPLWLIAIPSVYFLKKIRRKKKDASANKK